MSFFNLLAAIAKKHMITEAKPFRTPAPLRLSQGSAVDINIVPIILAEHAGALFHSDLPLHHTIVAIGQYSLFGLRITRCFLSQLDGAYLHFVRKGDDIVESRVYVPYLEVIPATPEEWAFWLADLDGYIGYPIMQSKDADGPIQYTRSWNPGNTRIPPLATTECLVDMAGPIPAVSHQLMHYTRELEDSLAEHLLVSAIETNDGMSVNFWLGIDLAITELTVFPAADAP